MASIDFVDLDMVLGHNLLSAVDTTQTQPLGRVRRGYNPLGGGVQEWVYVKNTSGGTLAVGEGLMFANGYNDFGNTSLSAANCPRPRFIGVAQHAIANNSYGWVQRKGVCTIKSTAGVTANTSIKPVASGVFSTGTMGTDDLLGAVGAAIAAGATGSCYLAG